MRLIDANDLKKNFIGKKYGVKAIEYQIEKCYNSLNDNCFYKSEGGRR